MNDIDPWLPFIVLILLFVFVFGVGFTLGAWWA